MMKFLLRISMFLVWLGGWPLRAQPLQPAEIQIGIQHFQKQEYESCLRLLEPFLNNPGWSNTAYAYVYVSRLQLKQYEEAEKLAQRLGRKFKGQVHYEVDRGYAMRLRGKVEEALKVYGELLRDCKGDPNEIAVLAGAFRVRAEGEWAAQVYLKGRSLQANPAGYALELADLAHQSGQRVRMIEHYLEHLEDQPQQLEAVQYALQQKLDADEMDEIRVALLKRLRLKPDETVLNELLIWYLVQQKDFTGAFQQAKALDMRINQQGQRVLSLARIAIENEDWKATLPMLDFVVQQSKLPNLQNEARMEILRVKYRLIQAGYGGSRDSLESLAVQYKDLLTAGLISRLRLQASAGYAELLAFDLGRIEEAMDMLEQIIAQGGESQALAEIKLLLGDLYVLSEIFWEAALVYGQVERDFSNQPLGHQAKFRNARLSFFQHEFSWAQAQLDVLKASTTTRMANDAMELALTIHDNYDLDTSAWPMQGLAMLEQARYRRQLDRAIILVDSLLDTLLQHPLGDDLWIRKAAILEQMGRYAEADSAYGSLLAKYGDEVLADDALFRRGMLWEQRFSNKERAMDLYSQLMLKFPDSAFLPEARRKIRRLRGDQNPEL
ncbi:MAG: tetratricopeptide repeat protein [Sphingomonadales bacterium]|nr:tetratricopeptide repeat protein [Sphingomonadales bacterium]